VMLGVAGNPVMGALNAAVELATAARNKLETRLSVSNEGGINRLILTSAGKNVNSLYMDNVWFLLEGDVSIVPHHGVDGSGDERGWDLHWTFYEPDADQWEQFRSLKLVLVRLYLTNGVYEDLEVESESAQKFMDMVNCIAQLGLTPVENEVRSPRPAPVIPPNDQTKPGVVVESVEDGRVVPPIGSTPDLIVEAKPIAPEPSEPMVAVGTLEQNDQRLIEQPSTPDPEHVRTTTIGSDGVNMPTDTQPESVVGGSRSGIDQGETDPDHGSVRTTEMPPEVRQSSQPSSTQEPSGVPARESASPPPVTVPNTQSSLPSNSDPDLLKYSVQRLVQVPSSSVPLRSGERSAIAVLHAFSDPFQLDTFKVVTTTDAIPLYYLEIISHTGRLLFKEEILPAGYEGAGSKPTPQQLELDALRARTILGPVSFGVPMPQDLYMQFVERERNKLVFEVDRDDVIALMDMPGAVTFSYYADPDQRRVLTYLRHSKRLVNLVPIYP